MVDGIIAWHSTVMTKSEIKTFRYGSYACDLVFLCFVHREIKLYQSYKQSTITSLYKIYGLQKIQFSSIYITS